MMDTILQQALATWPTELHQLAAALRIALPVLLILPLMWLIARGLQWLIDRYTVPRRDEMRTAARQQIERDVEELLWRGAQGFENTYPVEPKETARPRKRAGPPVIVPFPQPDAEVRNPRHLRRQP